MSFELWLFVQCSQLLSNCCLLAFSHTAADRDTWLSPSTQAWLKNVWPKKINSHQYPPKLNKIFYTSFTLHKYNVGHDQGIVNQWNNPKCQFSDRFLYNVQWTGWCSAARWLQWQCSAVVAAVISDQMMAADIIHRAPVITNNNTPTILAKQCTV